MVGWDDLRGLITLPHRGADHCQCASFRILFFFLVEGNPKAPFSKATTPGLLHFTLDSYLIMQSVKQVGIKYLF